MHSTEKTLRFIGTRVIEDIITMDTSLLLLLATGAVVGAASGYLGSFMVLRRMSLVGDALSHVALPGMAIALALGFDPLAGALLALTLAVIGIWYLGERSEIYPEALVGVFFTASLAIGILVTPEPELLETLFGDLDRIGYWDGLVTMILALVVFVVARRISSKLLLGVISEDLASSTGANISSVNFVYLLLVGVVVALGVKFVGTLLMGALVIVPAVAAKNAAKSINLYYIMAASIGILSVLLGISIARMFSVPSGPAVVLVSIMFFVLSYILKARK